MVSNVNGDFGGGILGLSYACEDVTVGVPGEDYSFTNGGSIDVLFGATTGLSGSGSISKNGTATSQEIGTAVHWTDHDSNTYGDIGVTANGICAGHDYGARVYTGASTGLATGWTDVCADDEDLADRIECSECSSGKMDCFCSNVAGDDNCTLFWGRYFGKVGHVCLSSGWCNGDEPGDCWDLCTNISCSIG